ncbi:EAL domain-containing protein [Denitratimonas sp. CY0512]|uniref:EAL domain-containing protein n=1 Tax=Denitratimonas sp. CY0512 TaxID=3131940 RepID=UPI0030B12B42
MEHSGSAGSEAASTRWLHALAMMAGGEDALALAAHICELPIALLSLGSDEFQTPCMATGLDAAQMDALAPACLGVATGAVDGTMFDPSKGSALPSITRTAGAPVPVFLVGVPLLGEDGKVLGSLCVLAPEPVAWDARRHAGLRLVASQLARRIRNCTSQKLADGSTQEPSWAECGELPVTPDGGLDAVISSDEAGHVTGWNLGAERIFGYRAEEMLSTPISRIVPEYEQEEHARLLRRCREAGRTEPLETSRLHRNGDRVCVLVHCTPVRGVDGRVTGVVEQIRDIRALLVRENEAVRLSRLYAALTRLVQVVAGEPPRDKLFQTACTCLVEDAGFSTAWVGWHEPATQRILPVAFAGEAWAQLSRIAVFADDRAEGRGVIGTAFRTGRYCVSNDLENDARQAPWQHAIRDCALRAAAAIPIRDKGTIAGTLNVYSRERGYFREQEISLLERFANGIGFGLEVLARTEAMRQTQQQAERAQRLTDAMIESMPGILYLYDREGRLLRWNRNFERLTGLRPEQIRDMSSADFVAESDRDRLKAAIERAFAHGDAAVEAGIRLHGGRVRPHLLSGRRVQLDGADCLVGVGIDISARVEAEELRRQSQERYGLLFEHAPAGVLVGDAHGICVDVNPAACRILGRKRSAILGKHLSELTGGDNFPPAPAGLARFADGGRVHEEWRLPHGPDKGVIVRVTLTGMPDGTFLLLMNDVTERKLQEHRLARLNRLRRMIGAIHSAMLRRKDRASLLREACRIAVQDGDFAMAWVEEIDSATGMLRRPAGSAACNSEDLSSDDLMLDPSHHKETLGIRALHSARSVVTDTLADSDIASPELACCIESPRGHSGAAFPLLVAGKVDCALVFMASEPGFFDEAEIELLEWVARDLSYALEHIETASQLHHLIHFDPLTGLMNAQSFHEHVEVLANEVHTQGGQLGVVMLDLEKFAQTNRQYGRAAGDHLLQEVGSRLSESFQSPALIARVGGDTFAVAEPAPATVESDVCEEMRRRLTLVFERMFRVGDEDIQLKARFGAAHYSAAADDADDLPDLERAGAALHLAKAGGERFSRYSRSGQHGSAQSLETQLHEALNQEQFRLVYQPRVDLVSGEIVGAEALLRWHHPERGLIMPGEFIGAAERSGLIYQIGNWVLDKVCWQQAQWRAAGVPLVQISANISAIQINRGDLFRIMTETLARHRLTPDLIELELTESAVLQDMATSALVLKQLRGLGVGLALDDFGTGYSSLSHLKQLPFHRVKIDRSFIVDVTRSVEDAAIALAIIRIARSLRLKAVGEGVETHAQLKFLTKHDCDEMQGNLFSPPIEADAFVASIMSRRKLAIPGAEPSDHRNLLVVDDEIGICNALTRLLRRDGYNILIARSGAEALDLLALHPIQVILSDQRMPGMSGTELLGKVKSLYPNTVRIILSGYTDLSVVTEAVNQGAVFRFLTKPWDDGQLRSQIRDAFVHYYSDQS